MAVTSGKRTSVETQRVIGRGQSYGALDDVINDPVLAGPFKTPRWWWIGFAIAATFLAMYLVSIVWLVVKGTGVWGNNVPVGWGMPIINFVWWIGIGHAGTLISAALLLFRQP